MHVEKMRVSTDDVLCTPFKRSYQVFVILRIFLNCLEFQTAFGGFSNKGQGYNPAIDLFRSQRQIPTYTRILHTPSDFIEDGVGSDEMKCLILNQQAKDAARRSLRTNQRANVNVGIKDGSNHTLLPARSASSMFGLVRQLIGQSLSNRFRFPIKNRQQVHPRRFLHLLKPFDGHHCRQRLALSFDHECIVPKRDAIQHVSKPLTNFQS